MATRERAIEIVIAFGLEQNLFLAPSDFRHLSDDELIGEMHLIESQNHWSVRLQTLAEENSGPQARRLPRL